MVTAGAARVVGGVGSFTLASFRLYNVPTTAVPERFVIDAKTLRFPGGSSLAERPESAGANMAEPPLPALLDEADATSGAGVRDAPADGFPPVRSDSSTKLGQGCFGKVLSMAWNGAPVAVKELSESTLDSASLGSSTSHVVTLGCERRLGWGLEKSAGEHLICSPSSIVVKRRDFALAGQGVLGPLAARPIGRDSMLVWRRRRCCCLF